MLALKHSRAVADMAELLYGFLPGSGDPKWRGHVSFKTVAEKVGVGDYWLSGSKLPAIVALLERTLDMQRDRFERLILEIVRAGITYRQKRGNPVRRAEVEKLNGLLLDVHFKFPDLWDAGFLASLDKDVSVRASANVEAALRQAELRESARTSHSRSITQLGEEFLRLHSEPDRQKAGYGLERILTELFSLEGLAPREPFRLTGEQVDGSFEFENQTYLVEAKWENEPLPEAPLLIFRGKIEGKSSWTRGVFISLSGATKQALAALTHGKQPNFFLIDGYDLTMVFREDISLPDLLKQRKRLLAEEGSVHVPYSDLWKGSRAR